MRMTNPKLPARSLVRERAGREGSDEGFWRRAQPTSVPTEPTALRAAIIAGIDRTAPDGESDDYDVLKAARDYLWETVPPVALRRAIFDMLMASPGIPHRAARDRLGRSGTAFSIDSSRGTRTRLTTILARDQGLLGEEQTLLDHDDAIDATPPVVIGYATYLDA